MSRSFPNAIDGTGGKRKGKGEPPPDDTGSGEAEPVLANSPDLDKKIRGFMDEIDALVDKRKSINQEITAILTDVESHGLDRGTFKRMLKIRNLDEEQRLSAEITERVIRSAIKLPMQADMFTAAGGPKH